MDEMKSDSTTKAREIAKNVIGQWRPLKSYGKLELLIAAALEAEWKAGLEKSFTFLQQNFDEGYRRGLEDGRKECESKHAH